MHITCTLRFKAEASTHLQAPCIFRERQPHAEWIARIVLPQKPHAGSTALGQAIAKGTSFDDIAAKVGDSEQACISLEYPILIDGADHPRQGFEFRLLVETFMQIRVYHCPSDRCGCALFCVDIGVACVETESRRSSVRMKPEIASSAVRILPGGSARFGAGLRGTARLTDLAMRLLLS